MSITKIENDEMQKGFDSYIETMFWSSPASNSENETLDQEKGKEDINTETLKSLREDFELFTKENYHLCTDKDKTPGIVAFAHNFWLNRNGHGAGFWDGDYINGKELSKSCEQYGQVDAYVGDDGSVYIMGDLKSKIASVLPSDANTLEDPPKEIDLDLSASRGI